MIATWPDIPYEPWRETCSALHLYLQIVGKYRLARTPWVNHSWHATFYVDAAGPHDIARSLMAPAGSRSSSISSTIWWRAPPPMAAGPTSLSARCRLPTFTGASSICSARSVARLTSTGAPMKCPTPFPSRRTSAERPYAAEAVTRFFHAMVAVDRVLKRFRTGYLGKVSPVHLFWGSFDLAVTRFSGRRAPLHPGGVPALPDAVTREAYSHEVSSAGFWPGGAGIDFPAFYSYAYPAPAGFADARPAPEAAYFEKRLGEFVLPYDAVRRSSDPEATLMAFLQTTYDAAADLGGWDRAALECEIGLPRRPRRV